MQKTQWFALAALTLIFACTTKEEGCAEGTHQCADTMLQVCTSGAWVDEEDCAAGNMICHDMGSMSHCMEEGAM